MIRYPVSASAAKRVLQLPTQSHQCSVLCLVENDVGKMLCDIPSSLAPYTTFVLVYSSHAARSRIYFCVTLTLRDLHASDIVRR
jgi:hypothetical protein